MKNWKTTTLGITGLVMVVCKIVSDLLTTGNVVINLQDITAILTSAGLIAAKDHNVTGGSVTQ